VRELATTENNMLYTAAVLVSLAAPQEKKNVIMVNERNEEMESEWWCF
jgi:hypothetical protein